MRADAVWQLGLMTVGTLGEARCLQGIVRATGAGALLGVSTFRIRHISTSTISRRRAEAASECEAGLAEIVLTNDGPLGGLKTG